MSHGQSLLPNVRLRLLSCRHYVIDHSIPTCFQSTFISQFYSFQLTSELWSVLDCSRHLIIEFLDCNRAIVYPSCHYFMLDFLSRSQSWEPPATQESQAIFSAQTSIRPGWLFRIRSNWRLQVTRLRERSDLCYERPTSPVFQAIVNTAILTTFFNLSIALLGVDTTFLNYGSPKHVVRRLRLLFWQPVRRHGWEGGCFWYLQPGLYVWWFWGKYQFAVV